MPRDPMMEIFMAECQDLISQYETYLSMAEEKQEYDLNLINEIFRITHTLKADATMMLYECVAVPMRAFEKVLYYCRDEIKGVLDFDEFSEVLTEVIEYTADELMRIEAGSAQENDGDALRERMLAYRDCLAARMHPDQVEEVEEKAKSELRAEPMRFYIGGQAEEEETVRTPVVSEAAVAEVKNETVQNAVVIEGEINSAEQEEYHRLSQKQTITTDELTELYGLIDRLQQLGETVTERYADKFASFADVMYEFDGLVEELHGWAGRAWMTPVSYLTPKLKRTVKEMNDRLGRAVTLIIEGENVPIEKGWIDRLSSAMVHLIRNAIDHGIESKESRVSKGKTPEGSICIRYQNLAAEKCFELTLEDDGRGVNANKIKEAAIQRGLIAIGEELSFEKILNLMFAPGITTNEQVSEYSGRGVGMDVVWHSVNELGGTIRVDSERDHGLKVIIQIPYHSTGDDEKEATNEDIDSRR